jgi:hypothetical protein
MGAFLAINGCQTPDELLPPVAHTGINSVTAYFTDGNGNILDEDNGRFTATVTEGNYNIEIPIPYYFPASSDNQVTTAMLSQMRMQAVLDDNVTVEPALLLMDLNQTNTITVTDQRKEKRQYAITGVIRKSSACVIEEFALPDAGLTGIVSGNIISLLTPDNITPGTATVVLSPHATISPDPRTTTLDYNTDQTFVVTAHDGTSATYTTKKGLPAKRAKGIRPESAKLIFAKSLAGAGVGTTNTNGIAVTKDYIVVSTRAANSVLLDPFTGEVKAPGTLDVNHILTTGSLLNFYNTADTAGNVLLCDLLNSGSGGTFEVFRTDVISGTITPYISWTGAPRQIGRKLSIIGSLDADAIITAPFHGADDHAFARWTVTGGVLNPTPDIITISGDMIWANNGSDVIYSSANTGSDYFVVGYKGSASTSSNKLARISGATNVVLSALSPITDNTVASALDYLEFNNAKYIAFGYARNQSGNEKVYLVDVENPLSGNPADVAVWSITNPHPPVGNSNGNSTSDFVLRASEDGNFLYLYYMFTTGVIACYQFDAYDI